MNNSNARADDFEERRQKLKNLTNQELKDRFWELSEKIVDPLLEISKNHTTPSLERSIVLRMGFSSLEADPIVKKAIDNNLISKGVGHLIYRVARDKNLSIREAGLQLKDGQHWDYLEQIFNTGE